MTETSQYQSESKGILYAGSAYVVWGLVPLYWRLLADVGPFELTAHRMVWCALFAAIVTLARGRLFRVITIFRTPRVVLTLTLSSVLIAANWTLYIWCVSTHRLIEASLGYYLTPLVSIALGVAFLGERVSALRSTAIGLAGVAVVVKAFALGHIPWIAPALALSFGLYGYVRKRTEVDPLDGLTVETLLLFPLTFSLVSGWALTVVGAFVASHPLRDILLIAAGPLTAVPLVLFAAGARRIRMTTLGFLQYLAPSITLVIATSWLGEKFTTTDAITFGFVWTALVLVGLEGQVQRSLARRVV